jgi:hypothetical protein
MDSKAPDPKIPHSRMPDSKMPASKRSRQQEKRTRTGEEGARWGAELAARFTSALTFDARAGILSEMDLPLILDEDSALALYSAQPLLASGFIQRHLPRGRRAGDGHPPWQRMMQLAQAHGDEPLYFALYRGQAAPEQWSRDTQALASSQPDSQVLCAELERRHPQRWRPDIGPHLVQLAQLRGEHLLPYVLQHAQELWSTGRRRSGYQPMAELARRNGWWELWASLVGACASTPEYDREVTAVLADASLPEPDAQQRLVLLASSGARLKPLRDATLLALYGRFPQLVRGAFRAQLDPSSTRPLSGLIGVAMEHRDDDLIDTLSSRLAVRAERSGADRLLQAAGLIAAYLERCESAALARRAAAILVRIPAHSIHNQRELMRRNPLARLLFERAAEACLASDAVAADLLQAEEDQVCAVAVRALTGEDARAVALARKHRDRVLACLDRRLPRPVARQAVRALDRLALESGEAAPLVAWARAALARHSPTCQEDELLAFLARQLAKHPGFRETAEEPTVYGRPS